MISRLPPRSQSCCLPNSEDEMEFNSIEDERRARHLRCSIESYAAFLWTELAPSAQNALPLAHLANVNGQLNQAPLPEAVLDLSLQHTLSHTHMIIPSTGPPSPPCHDLWFFDCGSVSPPSPHPRFERPTNKSHLFISRPHHRAWQGKQVFHKCLGSG